MRSIKTENGDLVITSKRMQMVDGLQQKQQKTRQCLLVVKGELFYNGDIGLNYTEILDIKEKNISFERKRLAVMQALSQDDNIEKIDSIEITTNPKSRKQKVTLKLKYKDEIDSTTIGGVTVG
ncbi:DUF2634 domain-containing protein [Clostridium magnum]|uniref:DUF2634 domain-containing protein n=1 Tax=Clostridium magnum TaxID=33954 RepID=UPI00091980D0|nr:DUF2634 domain-containing protein [Clostridium magnum]SHJ28178.1 Protein of unknown function [Clostridium magnum DSM 2767]